MKYSHINSNIDDFFSKTKELLPQDYHDLFAGQESYSSRIRPSRLSLPDLLEVFNKLNVTLDSVIENRVDYDVLVSQYGSLDIVPVRYTDKAALSSRFTGKYMINYIKRTLGEKAAKKVMQNFQLKETQFQSSHEKNNILLPKDLCDYMHRYYGPEAVFQMGQHSVSLLEDTAIGTRLSQSPNLQFMFELFFEEIAPHYVEKNYHWTIEGSGSNFITICGKPNEQVTDSFDLELKMSPSLDSLRKGFLTSLPQLLGRFSVDVESLKSIHEGDGCDMYRLVYSPNTGSHLSIAQ